MSTTLCGVCGGREMRAFQNEALALHTGQMVAGLSGCRCVDCGEMYLDEASMARYGAAGDAAVLAERDAQRHLLRRVRKKLHLTQHQAARLTGGGHNAIGRYERGEVQAMPAVINLFKLLDAHPELLREVQAV